MITRSYLLPTVIRGGSSLLPVNLVLFCASWPGPPTPPHPTHTTLPPPPPVHHPRPHPTPTPYPLPPHLQNKFLQPDPAVVDALVQQLQAKKVGVVAHFYMDPEVQGVLSSAGEAAQRSGPPAPCRQPARRQPASIGRTRLRAACTLPLSPLVHARPPPTHPHTRFTPQPSAGLTSTSATPWSWPTEPSRWQRQAAREAGGGNHLRAAACCCHRRCLLAAAVAADPGPSLPCPLHCCPPHCRPALADHSAPHASPPCPPPLRSTIAVLGVDFMSENVRAILDEAGYSHVKVGGCAAAGQLTKRLGFKVAV